MTSGKARTEAVTERSVLLVGHAPRWPAWLAAWLAREGLEGRAIVDPAQVPPIVRRARPRAIVVALDHVDDGALALVRRLKADAFTGLLPLLVLHDGAALGAAADAGADEVLALDTSDVEASARLGMLLRRSDRDTDVHPSTRLPGARAIERELARRIADGTPFAACYADLDHFKEFNDRYGYFRGDLVIRLLARLLHDVVSGLVPEGGFVGHIGGDDFLFILPLEAMPRACEEVVRVFDELIPLQYSEADRRAGYFLGKDRRGVMHRVPLMTLSVGVVTNQRRHFTRPADVSELATEMKSYAKTLPGSVWAVDRRRDDEGAGASVAGTARRVAGVQPRRTGGGS